MHGVASAQSEVQNVSPLYAPQCPLAQAVGASHASPIIPGNRGPVSAGGGGGVTPPSPGGGGVGGVGGGVGGVGGGGVEPGTHAPPPLMSGTHMPPLGQPVASVQSCVQKALEPSDTQMFVEQS